MGVEVPRIPVGWAESGSLVAEVTSGRIAPGTSLVVGISPKEFDELFIRYEPVRFLREGKISVSVVHSIRCDSVTSRWSFDQNAFSRQNCHYPAGNKLIVPEAVLRDTRPGISSDGSLHPHTHTVARTLVPRYGTNSLPH